MKQSLNTFLQSRFCDMLILFLIVLSLVGFSIETLPDLSSSLKHILFILEVVIVGVFTLEYIARVLAAEKPLSYIFSFFGVIDLVAILPFYLATTVDLRSLRILRLFRLLTILKIARYNVALLRFSAALRSAFDELLLFTFASLLLIFIAAVGIYHFEHPQQPEAFRSIFDCLWWAVATLTTVGYGDVYPITIGGKLFTFAVLMIGLGLVAVPAGIISSALAQGRQNSNHSE